VVGRLDDKEDGIGIFILLNLKMPNEENYEWQVLN
jgi:hypothetical protein